PRTDTRNRKPIARLQARQGVPIRPKSKTLDLTALLPTLTLSKQHCKLVLPINSMYLKTIPRKRRYRGFHAAHARTVCHSLVAALVPPRCALLNGAHCHVIRPTRPPSVFPYSARRHPVDRPALASQIRH